MITHVHSYSENSWSIDYNNPAIYLKPGLQSTISSQETIDELKEKFEKCSGLEGLKDLYLWLGQEFSAYKGGGKLIGITTIDQLLETKKLSGCSDNALVLSAVARYLGYPTVMIDTAGIDWAEKFQLGLTTSYVGHVFVEVYIDDNWILVDPTSGKFIRMYDTSNPVLPITTKDEKIGFYALLKGKDMWDYGVTEPDMLKTKLKTFAKSFDKGKIDTPSYQIERLTSLSTIALTTKTLSSIFQKSTITASITSKQKIEGQFLKEYLFIIGVLIIIIITSIVFIKRRK